MIKEEFVTLRNLKIYIKRMGEGVPLLFLHGGPGGEHRYFLPHLNELGFTNELIFYDQRGCGQTEIPENNNYTFEEEVEIIEELRKYFELEKLNIVCESWGTMLALLYSSQYPQQVNKIFMTAAVGASVEGYLKFGKNLEERLSPNDSLALKFLSGKYEKGEVDVKEIFNVIDPYYLYEKDNLIKKSKTKSNAVVNQVLGKEIINRYSASINPEVIKNIPILIAQGDSDMITPADLKELFIKYIPHAELEVIENCGHWSVIEKPDVLINLIRSYF
jgi:proline iminopeptidase